jgi:hypothetical protein
VSGFHRSRAPGPELLGAQPHADPPRQEAAVSVADTRPVLDRLRGEVLDGRGFALLRGMPVEDRPIAESATAYWGVGTYSAAPARRQMWVLMAHRSPLQPPAGETSAGRKQRHAV